MSNTPSPELPTSSPSQAELIAAHAGMIRNLQEMMTSLHESNVTFPMIRLLRLQARLTNAEALLSAARKGPSSALQSVIEERAAQEAKGWTAAHDDEHRDGALRAAAAKLLAQPHELVAAPDWATRLRDAHQDRRRQLVIAAALVVAEIERLDRAASAPNA